MAKQTDRKTPQIRFRGFNEHWENRKLGTTCKTFHSGTFIKATDIKTFGDYPVYGGNGRRGYSASYNHDGLYALIGRQGALCGNMNLSSGKAFFTEHAVAVQADDQNDTLFLYYLLDIMNLGQYSSQSAQPGLAVNKLVELSAFIGEKKEQVKIGQYFKELDRLIKLYQHKHEKLVTLKKVMLHKMFPQDGATTPEIRFKGFGEKWKVKRLEDIGEFNPKASLPEIFEYIDLESVIGTKMVSHRTVSKSAAPSRAQRLAQEGDLFFQTVRPYQKNNYLFALPYTDYVFSTGYAQIRPLNDGNFLLALMQRDLFVKTVMDNCTGTSYPAINSHVLSKIIVCVPSALEQQKIGAYFRKLDELISQHATQLEKLKQIKSACLAKMFV
ncbi:restriction endonuclease subunit S [Pectobacterium parvum]|uniref:restriction endonuclease subunit S n=1 Tax=Pectobacterium parvum TaxID=2778550 RepID=UPI00050047A2|nr:restriction endonuclease subunit S [Pectobacterium parvum]KFX14276.1 hypothetical protein KP17_10340 [Pectobacterium parvum]